MNKVYMCIDLKSFFASVECVERNLDPLNTNLVVADSSRTEKTICLAVTPSLKKYGLGGRARLYEVVQKVDNINRERRKAINYRKFTGKSYIASELDSDKTKELDFIVAPPRMKKYMYYSTKIYNIYLKYLSHEDIFPYSIDEVFCDITNYLKLYKMTPKELVSTIIKDVYKETGITATAGIGTNLYLAKICMDIVAKHAEPDEIGVRIAELDEMSFRKLLWNHKPLTSFWRVGPGIAKKLEQNKMYTMGDVARKSLENEYLLYKLFGVNAELLIDHAWGYENTTVAEVKAYKPTTNSLSTGQVLHEPYNYEKTKLIVKEMAEVLSLDLIKNKKVTKQIVLHIGYDIENLTNSKYSEYYEGEVVKDYYGRSVPKPAHGTVNIDFYTASSSIIIKKTTELFERIINKRLLVRRLNIAACNLEDESKAKEEVVVEQLNLFSPVEVVERHIEDKEKSLEETKLQHAMLNIKEKYGNNAILKGMNLKEGGTTIDRNKQVGGHKA